MPESFTDSPILGDRFQAALRLAVDHHRRQLRKGTQIPYPAHLLAVAALVLGIVSVSGEGGIRTRDGG